MRGVDEPLLVINLGRGDTPAPECTRLAEWWRELAMQPPFKGARYGRLQHDYAVAVLPPTYDEFEASVHPDTRRLMRKAAREGYSFQAIDPNDYLDDLFAINTSLPERQGRPMTAGYLTRPSRFEPPPYGCPRHRLARYGVMHDGRLVAYSWVYQIGEFCAFSTILGHGDHLMGGTMRLLVMGAIEDLMGSARLHYATYEHYSSLTPGLRLFKERLGFRPYWVEWQLADERVVSHQRHHGRRDLSVGNWPRLARRAVTKVRRMVARPAR